MKVKIILLLILLTYLGYRTILSFNDIPSSFYLEFVQEIESFNYLDSINNITLYKANVNDILMVNENNLEQIYVSFDSDCEILEVEISSTNNFNKKKITSQYNHLIKDFCRWDMEKLSIGKSRCSINLDVINHIRLTFENNKVEVVDYSRNFSLF